MFEIEKLARNNFNRASLRNFKSGSTTAEPNAKPRICAPSNHGDHSEDEILLYFLHRAPRRRVISDDRILAVFWI